MKEAEQVQTTIHRPTKKTAVAFENETNAVKLAVVDNSTKSEKIRIGKSFSERKYYRIPFAAFLYNFATKSY